MQIYLIKRVLYSIWMYIFIAESYRILSQLKWYLISFGFITSATAAIAAASAAVSAAICTVSTAIGTVSAAIGTVSTAKASLGTTKASAGTAIATAARSSLHVLIKWLMWKNWLMMIWLMGQNWLGMCNRSMVLLVMMAMMIMVTVRIVMWKSLLWPWNMVQMFMGIVMRAWKFDCWIVVWIVVWIWCNWSWNMID